MMTQNGKYGVNLNHLYPGVKCRSGPSKSVTQLNNVKPEMT